MLYKGGHFIGYNLMSKQSQNTNTNSVERQDTEVLEPDSQGPYAGQPLEPIYDNRLATMPTSTLNSPRHLISRSAGGGNPTKWACEMGRQIACSIIP